MISNMQITAETEFSFLPPKQLYRKIESIFKRVDKLGPPEIFARTFISIFRETLGRDLGVSSIQLHEKNSDYGTAIEVWDDSSDDLPREIQDKTWHCEESPWIGDVNGRLAAIIPANEDRSLVMIFFAEDYLASDSSYITYFTSSFLSLHYALVQNLKRLELQDRFEQARSIQKSLLPSTNPRFADFDIAALSIPAKEVGGDVYDFQMICEDLLSVTIGDAAGHGLAAALQARDVITGIRMAVANEMEITVLASTLNRVIHQSGLVSRFVSLIHGELSSTGWFRYVNAGHPLPLLFNGEEFQQLESTGMILGPQSESSYEFDALPIPQGSALILFTDGVIEHHRHDDLEFGIAGVKSWMQDWHGTPAPMALKALFQRLYDFGNGKPFHDDVTAIYISRVP